MAEDNTKKKKAKATKKGKRKGGAGLPSKRTLNLAEIGRKPLNLKLAIPGIILILCGAVLVGKYAVADRLSEMSKAQSEAQAAQTELDQLYAEIDTYGDLMDRYAHYTYSGMTAEELGRIERTRVVDLIQKVIVPQAVIGSWSVRGNELTINITGKTLQEVNLIVQSLEKESIVDFCKVTTAVMNENTGLQNRMNQEAAQGGQEASEGEGFVDSLVDVAGELEESRKWVESGEYENVVTDGEETQEGTVEIDLESAPVNANLIVYLINAEEDTEENTEENTEDSAEDSTGESFEEGAGESAEEDTEDSTGEEASQE